MSDKVLRVELSEAIRGRRSIRAYKTGKVSQKEIAMLLEAAISAPSAGNIQPWEFIVVRKQEMKRRLAEAAWGQSIIEQVPVVVVVCADENLSAKRYGDRGRALYCLQDTAAAIQNLLLTAYSLGLGTCWIGAFKEDRVRVAMKIPAGVKPVAIVPVGHPAVSPSPRKKRPLTNVVHRETF
jgi:nitroreductase